ncbi:LytR/AlgR family response regulator transcription factor [Mucilaginibacter sp. KACC 22063]|uniref:LytR/AlgR family response regulator transcription factor n=1 Tax=Mucilaginibacter sp. KACC 22063 TaxID=3025666 RepID=UPI002366138C|nr:LytTR family DNA-binding domain-containing protein [Mucilaginibacter sp. KACC 22063]WDF54869.1 LytTR family DNA-binding domain-containing protein [Mucilaginibacter sp. KACC 22063]
MDKINCLVVDDEPIARDILENYCKHLNYLHVVACCSNALEARAILQNQPVDVLFLDINMPVMDGISYAKTIRNKPQIIFTTAYKEFAADAFDLAACDYLLKPFSFDRFIIAIDKALDRLKAAAPFNPKVISEERKKEDFLFIKADSKIYKIHFDELLYAEAQGNYTKIVTTSTALMPKMAFSSFEETLPQTLFFRTHRSFIINKSKIDHIEGNRIFIKNTEIPIGSNYREQLMKQLGL